MPCTGPPLVEAIGHHETLARVERPTKRGFLRDGLRRGDVGASLEERRVVNLGRLGNHLRKCRLCKPSAHRQDSPVSVGCGRVVEVRDGADHTRRRPQTPSWVMGVASSRDHHLLVRLTSVVTAHVNRDFLLQFVEQSDQAFLTKTAEFGSHDG